MIVHIPFRGPFLKLFFFFLFDFARWLIGLPTRQNKSKFQSTNVCFIPGQSLLGKLSVLYVSPLLYYTQQNVAPDCTMTHDRVGGMIADIPS